MGTSIIYSHKKHIDTLPHPFQNLITLKGTSTNKVIQSLFGTKFEGGFTITIFSIVITTMVPM